MPLGYVPPGYILCVLCGTTWNVSRLDNLCEDCGVRLADAEHAQDLDQYGDHR
jgi:NMD protein affecting ribosome stability and mRNA decay